MSYHRSHRLFFLLLLAIFPVGETLLCLEMQCIVSLILKIRRTKAELHIKGINKVYIQFVFQVDFLLCLSSYVGSENGKFLTPKVLAARQNLHNGMHASLWPEDNKQKDIDQVQICLKYDSAAMYSRHAKKKSIHGIIHWDNIRKGHTVFAKECGKLGRSSFKSCKMLLLKD